MDNSSVIRKPVLVPSVNSNLSRVEVSLDESALTSKSDSGRQPIIHHRQGLSLPGLEILI